MFFLYASFPLSDDVDVGLHWMKENNYTERKTHFKLVAFEPTVLFSRYFSNGNFNDRGR